MQLGGLEWVARFTCQAVVRLVVLRGPQLGQFVFAPHGISSFHLSVDTLGFFTWLSHGPKSITFFSPGQTMFANILLAQASYMGIWVFFPGGTAVKNLPASAGDAGSIPGSGSFPAEGNGNPLQYSWLGNAMDSRSQFTGLQMSHARLSGLNITQNWAGQCHPTLFLCSYPSQKVVMWTYHRVITRVTEYVIS